MVGWWVRRRRRAWTSLVLLFPQMPVDDVPAEARRLIFGDVPDIQIFGVGDGVRGGG